MLGDNRNLVARLFGPSLEEVVRVASEGSVPGSRPLVWDVFPEVHVKCTENRLAEVLVRRFGDAVFSLTGGAFASSVGAALVARGWTLSVAESCTGGLIGHLVTEIPGASNWFRLGVVSYSNEAKTGVLGVPVDVISRHGAVSAECVEAMASSCRALGGSDVGIAVSGIAGPGGATLGKPVGTVWVGLAWKGGTTSSRLELAAAGSRERIKLASAYHALDRARILALSGKGELFQ
jgi:PncC family amidohydrolase